MDYYFCGLWLPGKVLNGCGPKPWVWGRMCRIQGREQAPWVVSMWLRDASTLYGFLCDWSTTCKGVPMRHQDTPNVGWKSLQAKPSPFKRNTHQFFLQVTMMWRSLCPQLNFPSRSQPISCLAQLNRLPSVATPRSGWMARFLAGCMWSVARCTKHRAMSLNHSEDHSENPAPNQEAHEAENPLHPLAWNCLFRWWSNLEKARQGPSGHPAKGYSELGRY